MPKKRAPWERPSYYRRVWDSPHRHTKGVSGTMRGKTKTMCCRTTQLPRISRDTHPCHGLLLAARAGVGVGDCLAMIEGRREITGFAFAGAARLAQGDTCENEAFLHWCSSILWLIYDSGRPSFLWVQSPILAGSRLAKHFFFGKHL